MLGACTTPGGAQVKAPQVFPQFFSARSHLIDSGGPFLHGRNPRPENQTIASASSAPTVAQLLPLLDSKQNPSDPECGRTGEKCDWGIGSTTLMRREHFGKQTFHGRNAQQPPGTPTPRRRAGPATTRGRPPRGASQRGDGDDPSQSTTGGPRRYRAGRNGWHADPTRGSDGGIRRHHGPTAVRACHQRRAKAPPGALVTIPSKHANFSSSGLAARCETRKTSFLTSLTLHSPTYAIWSQAWARTTLWEMKNTCNSFKDGRED